MNRCYRKTLSCLGFVLLPQSRLFSLLPSSISPIPSPPGFHIIPRHDSRNTVALTLSPRGGVGKEMLTQDSFSPLLIHYHRLKEKNKQTNSKTALLPRAEGQLSSLWINIASQVSVRTDFSPQWERKVRASHSQGVLAQARMESYSVLLDFQMPHESTLSTPHKRLVQALSFTSLPWLSLGASTMQFPKQY